MNLGRAIKTARKSKGWGQRALAQKLSVSPTYISQLENDRRDPSWSFINKLSEALEVPLPLLILLASDNPPAVPAETPLSAILAHELLGLVAGQGTAK